MTEIPIMSEPNMEGTMCRIGINLHARSKKVTTVERVFDVTVCEECKLFNPNCCEECGNQWGCALDANVDLYFRRMESEDKGDDESCFYGALHCPLLAVRMKNGHELVPETERIAISIKHRYVSLEEAATL